jgi:hypothetical protein
VPWLIQIVVALVIVGLILWVIQQITNGRDDSAYYPGGYCGGGLPLAAAISARDIWGGRGLWPIWAASAGVSTVTATNTNRRGLLAWAAALVTGSAALLSSCQPSTLVQSLEGVITAAEVALPVIGAAAGLPPGVLVAIVAYLRLVSAAAAQASTILAGPGSSAEKSAQIVAAFGNLAAGCNCLPAGVPSAVLSVINAVVASVVSFLTPFLSRGLMASKPVAVKVSPADRAALAKIRARCEANAAKLGVIR